MATTNFYVASTKLFTNYNLSKCAFKVACCLSKSANYKTRESYKAKATLAEECGYSVSSITRACRELVKAGLLEIKARKNALGLQTSNIYKLIDIVKKDETKPNENTTFKCATASMDLQANELKVYSYIALRVGNRGTLAITRKEIATACNIGLSTVSLILRKLKKEKYISVKTGYLGYYLYTILYDKVCKIKENEKNKKIISIFTKEYKNNNIYACKVDKDVAVASLRPYSTPKTPFEVNRSIMQEYINYIKSNHSRRIWHTEKWICNKLGIDIETLANAIRHINYSLFYEKSLNVIMTGGLLTYDTLTI